ncbi:MAG: GNAT family protein [Ignavibacteriota bacterium]
MDRSQGLPSTRSKAIHRGGSLDPLLRYVGHWALLGFGYWAGEEKASGIFVGEVGFADYKRDMQSPVKELPEIGWVLVAAAHERVTRRRAALAALRWGDSHFPESRTTCIISPDNLQSIRVAEKCGYRDLELTLYKGQRRLCLCESLAASYFPAQN